MNNLAYSRSEERRYDTNMLYDQSLGSGFLITQRVLSNQL